MRRLVAILLVFVCAMPLWAQDPDTPREDTDRERGILQSFIEDNLSDAGREVRISGFEGALSSQANLDEMTIADAEGIWLTLRGVTLDWTRSALLRGRLEVNRLSAEEIILPRLPVSEDGLETEDAAASPFALPDLPVSVRIDELQANTVSLGAPLLGEALELSVLGGLALADGNGQANLDINRLNGEGTLGLDAEFSNNTRELSLDLDVNEGQGGILSGMMNLPGRPALGLTLNGAGPLDDFEAKLALTRNGVRRLGGTLRTEPVVETTTDTRNDPISQRFSARLSGDIQPFLAPELRAFFDGRTAVNLNGWRTTAGATVLEDFTLRTAQMALSGQVELDPQNWPRRFAVSGRVASPNGMVRLPVSGPALRISGAEIQADYDAADGDSWAANVRVRDLRRDGLRIGQADLTAQGEIRPEAPRSISSDITFSTATVSHDNADLAQAIGPAPRGAVGLAWQDDAPLRMSGLTLTSGDAELRANAQLDALREGVPISGRADLNIGNLARFAPLAGRELKGAAQATVSGNATLLSGAFDADITAQTNALAVGEARLDGLLAPQTDLIVAARRDETGTTLDQLSLSSSAIQAQMNGTVTPTTADLQINARLPDISLAEPRLTGALAVQGGLGWTEGGAIRLDELQAQLDQTHVQLSGTLDPSDTNLPVDGTLSVKADDLSRFSRIAQRALGGQLVLEAQGKGAINGDDATVTADLTGQNLRTGIATLDTLLTGAATAKLDASRSADGISLRTLRLEAPRVSVVANGTTPGAPIDVNARLSDLALIAPGINGPAQASGSVVLRDGMGRDIGVDLQASGPGGTTANLSGDIREMGQALDLALTGAAPLGLANGFIAPRSVDGRAQFDLRVSGAPALGSVSGRITLADGRIALPTLSTAFENLQGGIDLSNGSAEINISANGRERGSLALRGPVGLQAPYPANLTVLLNALGHSDPDLYKTKVSGVLSMTGPLSGGAQIGGQLQLGETEIRVPSSNLASVGLLPQLRHVGEPPAVTETRRRAGLIQQAKPDAAGPAFGLDLTILAPNRIFVRGRGLDAELGGRLRVGGTTNDVVPSGMFELIRGRLDILGKRLTLTEGRADLRGAFDPYLRFVAESDADDVTLRVIVEGLASEPDILFTSTPDLPQEEVVARLIFGRSLDQISPFQAAQLAAAVATLAGRIDDGLLGGLRKSVGLSNLDVTTSDEGATQLSAGAYISENIYSEISADSEGKQQIDLNIDLSRNVTVKGRLNSEGNTGVGIYFEKDY